ncbi:protein aurora borealis isoform X2 [Anguilla anguilla]|uniref:protein aurora borealis isoform X2 n=1 Tax=Anguilla anguilla TaxID=7936 RepID=UPI0015B2A8F9|nr:protein aurora borealis isoform X2 [Anguilla anguilla]
MGDVAEVQITPETPGRAAIHNPFESPNDYHRLHESTVPSPSVFRSSRASSATPGKFKWSIDEMANLLPVEIDPEDIHRQCLYLSQTRADAEIEEKRQNAIEQFFTKGPIVPSPWASSASKPSKQMHFVKSSLSPEIPEEDVPGGKCSAACQTVLSLPVDFDLEKILGEHYKLEEVSDQVQESLSSSSLRRKLFLDGIGSGSESSTPSSPDGSPRGAGPGSGGAPHAACVSPLPPRGMAAVTPTSGQFSSSPIQSRSRAYSLGSVASPLFPEGPSPGFRSPALSPIVLQYMQTPVSGEKKQLTFVTPEGMTVGNASGASRPESLYVEGCSPIKSSSPIRPPVRGRAPPPYKASLSELSPPLGRPAPADRGVRGSSASAPPVAMETCLPASDCGPAPGGKGAALPDLVPMEETRESSVVTMAEPGEEREDCCAWNADAADASPARLTSSRTASMFHAESSAMFVSLLAEGGTAPYDTGTVPYDTGTVPYDNSTMPYGHSENSTMPYDNSMQVDSGYNTYSVGTNGTIDGTSSDSQTKESLDPQVAEAAFLYTKTQHIKSKMFTLHH